MTGKAAAARFLLCAFLFLASEGLAQTGNALWVPFTRGYGQVEVGGPFAGAEFHDSRPLPSRVSFYAPVANSIDLSTDYWKRGDSRPFVLGVRINNGERKALGKEPWHYFVSPYRAQFQREEEGIAYTIRYDFCQKLPAMVMQVTAANRRSAPVEMELYAHEKITLRSCQTYARFDSADMSVSPDRKSVIARFHQPQLAAAAVFVTQAGALPEAVWTDARRLMVQDSGWTAWFTAADSVMRSGSPKAGPVNALAASLFRKRLNAGDSLSIVQVIGSCSQPQAESLAAASLSAWRTDVAGYSASIERAGRMQVTTGLPDVDSSSIYARAIVEANQHYIHGSIVPMPCPAEYNFFFTHDVLLTGLAAVLFDTPRVKRDLEFIIAHASGDTIPHAYYWRDDGFKTELTTPDNWNHLWFILLNAWYYRHTFDEATASRFYPYVSRSVQEILKQYRNDSLMYAFRPDWWDIGRREGPRAFITILTIRALREYAALSTALGRNLQDLARYERMAEGMEKALAERLWDPAVGYLINYNEGQEDRHVYMGSLLAPAFGLVPPEKAAAMMRTASKELVAKGVGVRTVFPVDFNTDSARAFFKFVGNEAGDPYLYANGGVWPHCNAWYTMALQRSGMPDSALAFYRTTMTINGILNSPMGQPAMYEYRYSDPSSPEYGRIDKPSFLWAGGFSLLTLYHLMGVRDNPWNVSLGNQVPTQLPGAAFPLACGGNLTVTLKGHGAYVRRCMVDGVELPSRILAESARGAKALVLELAAQPAAPMIDEATAFVRSAKRTGKNRLEATVMAWDGHSVRIIGSAPGNLKKATVDGSGVTPENRKAGGTRSVQWSVTFPANGKDQRIVLTF